MTGGNGRVAWVTGASSGIGRSVCLLLARQGWHVVASARSADKLNALVAEAPLQIEAVPLDVVDLEAVKRAVGEIEQRHGGIALALFCAGTYQRDEPSRFDSTALGSMVELNIMGTARCIEAVLPGMLQRRSGQVSVVSSVSGYTGLPGAAFYGATKSALITLCEAMYPELKAKGVSISVVAPGFVETPLTDKNDFPMPFIVTADEAARAIVDGLEADRFLISFPWKMALSMRLLSRLPYRMRFALTKRMLRKED